jgi:hypothetical protein
MDYDIENTLPLQMVRQERLWDVYEIAGKWLTSVEHEPTLNGLHLHAQLFGSPLYRFDVRMHKLTLVFGLFRRKL